jgi:hypothetical protein
MLSSALMKLIAMTRRRARTRSGSPRLADRAHGRVMQQSHRAVWRTETKGGGCLAVSTFDRICTILPTVREDQPTSTSSREATHPDPPSAFATYLPSCMDPLGIRAQGKCVVVRYLIHPGDIVLPVVCISGNRRAPPTGQQRFIVAPNGTLGTEGSDQPTGGRTYQYVQVTCLPSVG